MKNNKLILPITILAIITIVGLMAYDLFIGFNPSPENVYEYNLDHLSQVDSSLINYSETLTIESNIENLRAIAVDRNDQIYITGKDKIHIYNTSGILIKEIYTGFHSFSIAVNERKDIYVAQRDRVIIFNSNGSIKDSLLIEAGKPVITSILLNESNIFIADAGNKIVYRYNHQKELLNEIGRKDVAQGIKGFLIPSPFFDMAFGRDGELWVVNPGRHQLESYNFDGRLISSWHKTSMGLDGFSGCCNPTNIAILSNGSFVTSEKGIIRVKIHEASGDFKSVVAAPTEFKKGTKGLDIAIDSKERILVIDPKKGMIRIFTKNDN